MNIGNLFFCSTILWVLLLTAPGHADSLLLRNGEHLEGRITEENDTSVTININRIGFFKTYPLSEIESIKRTPSYEMIPHTLEANPPALKVGPARIIENDRLLLYTPRIIIPRFSYPLIVVLDPNADVQAMIEIFRTVADTYRVIIAASKQFRSEQEEWMEPLRDSLDELCRKFPVNPQRIAIAGFANGGTAAHSFTYEYPGYISAVLSTEGIIAPRLKEPDMRNAYPRDRIAILLASPVDRSYGPMKEDMAFLQEFGWTVAWRDFSGGHTTAPKSEYREAVGWLLKQWRE